MEELTFTFALATTLAGILTATMISAIVKHSIEIRNLKKEIRKLKNILN